MIVKSKEEIDKEIEEVIEKFGTVENIIGCLAKKGGRACLVHRELSSFDEFVQWFIFSDKSTFFLNIKFKKEYREAKIGNCDNTEGQLLRWAALYYIYDKNYPVEEVPDTP
ncbi:hypothetical protein [Methanobrevibacter olleyae]|uniref:Uncharacterized protein n=1 Tax=Methanobrevibacter olleyae TaxID=294671 RepID=A0A126R1N9_METOL|nr:hypothetical protein [Methanobrevibacter olleyae]AMK16310.1 hypothetical protein YLM1_1755 [Methanobrevibacter olleyae]